MVHTPHTHKAQVPERAAVDIDKVGMVGTVLRGAIGSRKIMAVIIAGTAITTAATGSGLALLPVIMVLRAVTITTGGIIMVGTITIVTIMPGFRWL